MDGRRRALPGCPSLPCHNGAGSVFAADIDGDGDMDLASASLFDDKIAWYSRATRGRYELKTVVFHMDSNPKTLAKTNGSLWRADHSVGRWGCRCLETRRRLPRPKLREEKRQF